MRQRGLREKGLVIRYENGLHFDTKHLLLWRGGRWGVDSQALVWWIRDVVISKTIEVPLFKEWLEKKRYRLIFTEEQWDRVNSSLRDAPEWAIKGIADFARRLFKEISQKR